MTEQINQNIAVERLFDYGWNSSPCSPKSSESSYIDLVSPWWVSTQCWQRISDSSTSVVRIRVDFTALADDPEALCDIYRFIFDDPAVFNQMVLLVMQSAKGKRASRTRRDRLEDAGGRHDERCLNELFKIQQGRCYYTGDLLTPSPKNYDVDHIVPIADGGSNWPINLALATKAINNFKGAFSADFVIKFLESKHDKAWAKRQKKYRQEVNVLRAELDERYRSGWAS